MKQNQQSLAKDLYLNTDKTQQEIADILDVNRRTVYLWIKTGKWEEMKIAARQAPGIILQDMYNHITAINDRIRKREEGDRDPTMEEVEKLRKLVGITTSIQKRNVGSYMEAFQELVSFIARRDHELAGNIIPHADSYVKGNFGDKIFHASKERDENIRDVIARLKKEDEEMASIIPTFADEQPFDNDETQTCVTPPSPSERAGVRPLPSCDNNEIFCDKNTPATLETPSVEEEPKPATTEHFIENDAEPEPEKCPAQEISENGIFFTLTSPLEKTSFDRIMELPPAQRPSPWRDENIIWVTNLEHLEYRTDNFGNPWGEMKMSDTIRHYPDVDPVMIRNEAFAQMMKEMQQEEDKNRNRPAA